MRRSRLAAPGQAAAERERLRSGACPRRRAHLRDELLDAGERALPAQALEELELELRAVEVAAEVEQVGLDRARRGRSRTSGARRCSPRRGSCRSAQARVDAVAGRDEARVGDEVRGRVAERAPALVAVHDLAGRSRTARRAACSPYCDVAPPATSPRMWLEETISPSTSSSGTTRVSKRSSAREHRRVARSRGGRSGSSRPPTRASRRARPTSTWSTKSCAERAANALSNGDRRRAPRRRAPPMSSALRSSEVSSCGGVLRVRTTAGCGSKVTTVSAPRMTSRWPRCTPSNVPTARRRGRARRPGGGSR